MSKGQKDKRTHAERMANPGYASSIRRRNKSETQRMREWKAQASPEHLAEYSKMIAERRRKYLATAEGRALYRAAKRRRYERGLALISFFKIECVRCDETDKACLQFHHRDPSRKIANVIALASQGKKRIMEEIAKCDVMCANCHLKSHAKPQTELNLRTQQKPQVEDALHMIRMARARQLAMQGAAGVQR